MAVTTDPIYAEGVAGRMATFETAVPTWQTFDAGKRPDCRFVARRADGVVLGWAALSPVSKRACYAGVAEVSVYVAGNGRGMGVGKALMAALVLPACQDPGREDGLLGPAIAYSGYRHGQSPDGG